MFKLDFYHSIHFKFPFPVFFKYDLGKIDRLEVINRIYYDKPLNFEEMIVENNFFSLDLSKEFKDELELKNWLLDNHYERVCNIEFYECWKLKLTNIKGVRSEMSSVDLYTFWRKEIKDDSKN